MNISTDTCITGFGVSCGAEVSVRPDCSIGITGGLLIFQNGDTLHLPDNPGLQFRYYVRPDFLPGNVKQFMLAYLGISTIDSRQMAFLLLSDSQSQNDQTDSLKQQHPEDVPEQNLLWNKILVVLSLPGEPPPAAGVAVPPPVYYWLLVSRTALASRLKIGSTGGANDQG